MNQNMMEGVLRSAWDAFYFFAIACVLSENQLKLVLESHRLVIEFSHRKFWKAEEYDIYGLSLIHI